MSAEPQGIDLERLRPWFAANVPGATADRPLSAELIVGGRSNLTYAITDGEHRWVLRRPPLGHVLETAHDMGREYRVIAALHGSAVPVPDALAFCDDPGLSGAPFYVMSHVDGRILRTADDTLTLTPDEARRCSEQLVDVLAALHSVDYEAVRFGDFGRPDGFLGRNLHRWSKQWEASKTRELPGVDELRRRLESALPESGKPAIVHGDYRLDNTLLAGDDPGRVVAVLDWEMSTLGDPLTDVGLLLLYWNRADGAIIDASPALPPERGWLPADAVVARYAERSGRRLDVLDFYVVFAYYKLTVILEGIHARFRMGRTLGDGFDEIGPMVEALVDQGLALATASSIPALRG